MKIERGSGNVFADLGLPDTDAHLLKAELVTQIDKIIRERRLKQVDAAKLLGLSQPDVSRLLRGSFREYSMERLLRLLTALGPDVDIVFASRTRSDPDGSALKHSRSSRAGGMREKVTVPFSSGGVPCSARALEKVTVLLSGPVYYRRLILPFAWRRDTISLGLLTMSLLGHLIPRIASGGVEPAATQALAYILHSSTRIAQAFCALCPPDGAQFQLGRVVAEEQHEDNFPDLTIRDTAGVVRVFVENKFWAGLTDAQPTAYLEALPSSTPSTLLFIVPRQRMYGLWDELKRRCDGKLTLKSETRENAMAWARAGQRILAITSWKHVLQTLEHAATGHAALQQDIVQLRGLTDQMNVDAFLPLHGGEVTDVNVPRRLINYINLVDEIVGRLKTDGIANTKGLQTGNTFYSTGRYLRFQGVAEGDFVLWLGISLKAWRNWGITPIWSRHYYKHFSGFKGGIRSAQMLFDDAQVTSSYLFIPIRLTTGADRARVIDDAVRQMRSIADRFREAFPE